MKKKLMLRILAIATLFACASYARRSRRAAVAERPQPAPAV
jgi:hypothetical protein